MLRAEQLEFDVLWLAGTAVGAKSSDDGQARNLQDHCSKAVCMRIERMLF
jgi:hypothetical protein